MNERKPQNACEFGHPSSAAAGWLRAYASDAKHKFCWIESKGVYVSSNKLARSLANSRVKMLRCIVYVDGSSALLVRGPEQEVDRICRLASIESFLPEHVGRVWAGALPMPKPLLDKVPLCAEHGIRIMASDNGKPHMGPSLLDIVSMRAGVDLGYADRIFDALGAHVVMVGVDRIEKLVAVVELHHAGQLMPKSRKDFVKSVECLERIHSSSELPDKLVDQLHLIAEESSVGQLDKVWNRVREYADRNMDVRARQQSPKPGQPVAASIIVSMSRMKQPERDELSASVKQIAESIGAKMSMSWRYDVIWN